MFLFSFSFFFSPSLVVCLVNFVNYSCNISEDLILPLVIESSKSLVLQTNEKQQFCYGKYSILPARHW